MRLTALRSRASARAFSIASALVLVILTVQPGHAQDAENYTISGNDGYGIADCMKAGSECGRVIADSWCESHGHAHAIGFGLGADVTGATADQKTPVVKIAANDVVIRCGD